MQRSSVSGSIIVACQVLGVTRGLTVKLQNHAPEGLSGCQIDDRNFGAAVHQSRREAQGVVRVLASAKSKGGGGIRGSHQYTTP